MSFLDKKKGKPENSHYLLGLDLETSSFGIQYFSAKLLKNAEN